MASPPDSIIRLFAFILPALAPVTSAGAQALSRPTPEPEWVRAAGFERPIPGRWRRDGPPVALGVPGAGYVEVFPGGVIDTTHAGGAASGSLEIALGGRNVRLLSTRTPAHSSAASPDSPLLLSHFPLVDLDYARPGETADAAVRLAAPFLPGDPAIARTPALLVILTVRNRSRERLHAVAALRWENPAISGGENRLFQDGRTVGVEMEAGAAGGAIAVVDQGWRIRAEPQIPGEPRTAPRLVARLVAEIGVPPGEERSVTFAYGWKTSDSKAPSARESAVLMAQRAVEVERGIIAWQSRMFTGPLPPWLLEARIAALELLARTSRRLAGGALALQGEVRGVPCEEPVSGRFLTSLPLLRLFPEEEKRAIRAIAASQRPDGEIPAALGTLAHADAPLFGPAREEAALEFVLMAHRDIQALRDPALAKELLLSARRALEFALALDRDGDGLIDQPEKPVIAWPWYGAASHTALLQLAALKAGESMARDAGDTEFAARCTQAFSRARESLDENLWNGRFYRLYTDPDHFRQSDACFATQLDGPLCAWLAGLGDVVPPVRAASSARAVADLNLQASEFGAALSVLPSGRIDAAGGAWSSSVAPAETWRFAAAALFASRAAGSDVLRSSALRAAERAWRTAWPANRAAASLYRLYSAREGTPVAMPFASANLSVWAVAEALAPPAEPVTP